MPEDSSQASTHVIKKIVRARICFSDELPPGCPAFELPDGVNMMEVELDDTTLIIIRPGSMQRPLFDEWNRYLDRITTQGNWSREDSRMP